MGIFISYRRSDSQEVVSRIYDRLVAHFPSEHVFRDLENLRPGEKFATAIQDAISSASVTLVIIGREWAMAKDLNGVQRLSHQADPVRVEIETALRARISIVPVLVQGAVLPQSAAVPESLRPMLQYQIAQIRPDPDFHRDMDGLIKTLGALLKKPERFADARALANFMTELSEDCFYAGWLVDFEYILWNSMMNSLQGGYQLGQDFISKRDHNRLWHLKEACAGWIIWVENQGMMFVPIEIWEWHLDAGSNGKFWSRSALLKRAVSIF